MWYKDIFTWLNDLARWVFDKQLTTIQVCDSNLKPTKSFYQANTLYHVKVTAITAEFLNRFKSQICCLGSLKHVVVKKKKKKVESVLLTVILLLAIITHLNNHYQKLFSYSCFKGDIWVTYLMFFLLQHQDYVSWFDAWCLVSFPRKCDLLPMFHAFVHMNLQKLSLLAHLMTLTLFAAILLIYHFTWTNVHYRD